MLNRKGRTRRPRGSVPSGDALGTRIRKARQELGLSLAAVAGKDFSRAFLNQVELGRARPSTHTLQIIAERLQRPIEYFLEDPEVSTPAIELTIAEAETRVHQGDSRRAETLLDRLLERPIPLDARIRGELVLARARLKRGAVSEAVPLLQGVLSAAERASFKAVAVEATDALGTAAYLMRRVREAGHWFDRALELYQAASLRDPLLLARILGHRANLHYVAGEAAEAISAYESAIAAAEHVLDMPALAGIYEGLAVSFQSTGDMSRALTYAQRSLRLFETLQDIRMSAQLRNNMAEMLLQQGRAAEAERLFREGAEQLERIGDRELRPFLIAGTAEALLERNLVQEAAAATELALEAARHTSDPLARIAAHRVAGRVANAQQMRDESRAHFEQALAEASSIESPDLRAKVTYDYARALESQGDARQAAARFREAYEAERARAAT